jgi:hypothetical protein
MCSGGNLFSMRAQLPKGQVLELVAASHHWSITREAPNHLRVSRLFSF